MAANNFRVHTDANYRLRDDIAPLMQSSRYFNQNNCMQSRSLRRNIISDHFVQPYTKKFADGSCDYNVARESELKIGNHNYYNRPQNYESQLGLSEANMRGTNANSKLDQAYNLVGDDLPPISGNRSSDYYPYAYGGTISGTGAGVMGGFNQTGFEGNMSGRNPGYYEPYTYKSSGGRNQVLRDGESNFGQFNPRNTMNTTPTHAGYNQNLSYRTINHKRRSMAGTTPKMSGMYNEGFQHRPRDGFFFDERYINPNYPSNNPNTKYDDDVYLAGDTYGNITLTVEQAVDTIQNLEKAVEEATEERDFDQIKMSNEPMRKDPVYGKYFDMLDRGDKRADVEDEMKKDKLPNVDILNDPEKAPRPLFDKKGNTIPEVSPQKKRGLQKYINELNKQIASLKTKYNL
tara:strand:- start:335 stop:1543 length:1209 start_codon:yes stop_codon:yes gene_type:complete